MPRIEAVIFDVDGTIIDTSEWVVKAHEHALITHGLPARTIQEIASQVGKRLADCYAFLAPGANHEELIVTHRRFQGDNFALIRPFEFANEVLAEIKQANRRMALFSSRSRLGPSLQHVELDESLFDMIIDGAMVENGKPHPQGIHLILERLELDPDQVIMIGDAVVDIEAAKSAQLASVIAITHGFGTRAELEAAEADHIIDSLLELPNLIDRIEQHESR